jgi:hypothetical protein
MNAKHPSPAALAAIRTIRAVGAIGAVRAIRAVRAMAAIGALSLLLAHCGGGSGPTAPPSPTGDGQLFFVDSGCACVTPPYPPIPIYVDGQQAGLLQVFGKLSIFLAPGPHTWSDFSASDPSPNRVVIQPGQTLTENLFTNLSCSTDDCSADSAAMTLRTPGGASPSWGSRPPH